MEENFLHQLDKGDICHYPDFSKNPVSLLKIPHFDPQLGDDASPIRLLYCGQQVGGHRINEPQ